MIIFLLIKIFFYLKKSSQFKRKQKVKPVNNSINLNKNDLNAWMNLTKKERYNQSKQESISYLNKRKLLLEEIRKEYKRISQKNSKKT